MTAKDKKTMYKMLNDSIKNYKDFRDREDFPDKPCIRKETLLRQGQAFHLIDVFFHNKWITFEEWCQYCCEIDMTEDMDETCNYKCGANINGKCKYISEKKLDKTTSINIYR